MLDAPREWLVDRIPDEADAQETRQELGDQSAAGWASGMSAPDIPLGPRRTSARCRADNSHVPSEDTGSTQGSTFVEDGATVSSLGDPEGTYRVGKFLFKVLFAVFCPFVCGRISVKNYRLSD